MSTDRPRHVVRRASEQVTDPFDQRGVGRRDVSEPASNDSPYIQRTNKCLSIRWLLDGVEDVGLFLEAVDMESDGGTSQRGLVSLDEVVKLLTGPETGSDSPLIDRLQNLQSSLGREAGEERVDLREGFPFPAGYRMHGQRHGGRWCRGLRRSVVELSFPAFSQSFPDEILQELTLAVPLRGIHVRKYENVSWSRELDDAEVMQQRECHRNQRRSSDDAVFSSRRCQSQAISFAVRLLLKRV